MSIRPPLATRYQVQQASAGFTLFESLLVILILGIISAYAAPKVLNTSQMTLDSQAKMLAADLQRAQSLATTTGSDVYFCATRTGYRILIGKSCTTNPAPTPTVSVTFDQQATLASTTSVTFDSSGQPSSSANFVLSSFPANSGSITVTTAAVTGLVSLSP
jgi:prepilin-type N-terminal cleavage/methylation domain-containing protein